MSGLLASGEAAVNTDDGGSIDLFALVHLYSTDQQGFRNVIDGMDDPATKALKKDITCRLYNLRAELDDSRYSPERSKMDNNGNAKKVREADDIDKEIHLLLKFKSELIGLIESRVFGDNTAPEITAPEVAAPEVAAPEVAAPEIAAPSDKDDGCCGLGGCFGLLPKMKDALVPMEQEGSFTDAAVRPDPQPAVSSIVRPNPQFVGCTDCPECNQSPLYHDMHGCGLQARDPERLGNQLARDENEDEGDDEGDDAQIDVVYHPLGLGQKLSLATLGIRYSLGHWIGVSWTFLVLPFLSFVAVHFCFSHGLYDDVCTVASQFGFCDRDSSASSGELILTFIFALLWAVQFLCVYWPTVESHVVSDVLAWLTVESHVVSDVLAAENYFTDEDGKVCIEDSSDEEDTTLARKSYIEIGDSSDEEDRKLPGKDLAGSSDSESKRRYLRIDDSSDEEEPAHPAKRPRAIHLYDSSDSDSEDHTRASSSRSSSHGTQSAARGSRSSNSAARRGIPNVSDQQNSSVKDKIPQPELKAIQDTVVLIISDDNRLQADQVDMNRLTILEGKHPTRRKIKRGFNFARNILHNWVHNCSTSESNPWGRALLCNHMIMVLERLKDSMLVSEKVKYPLHAFVWIAKCMLPKGKRQGATLEAGGHIDDGRRSLSDIATTRGVDALVSTMPQGGLDYCPSEDGNPFPGIVFNRAPYCEMTACKKHCKKWTIVFAARMMIPTLAFIYFVCGVLGIPLAIGNVGGTGCQDYFRVLLYTLSLLPDEILAFITVAPTNTHAHNLCWLPIGSDLGQHLSMVRRYLTTFFGVMGGFFDRLRFRKQMLNSDEELTSTNGMLTSIYDNDNAYYCQPATREGAEAGENSRFAQMSAVGRLGGLASWNARVDREGMEGALEFMAKIASQGGLAAWKARVEKDGVEGAHKHMADLGRASAESRRATLGEQGFRDSMTKVAHASAGIDSNAQDELKSDLTEAVRMVTQSPGFQDKGHHDKLTTVQGQLVAKIDEQWNHLKPDRASSKTQIANVASANIFEVYLGPLPMKIALYPCTKDTKMLARALHSVIYSEKELCELLLHREGIGKGDGMLDKPGLQEFICKVLTGDPTAMANKLHKCPKCDFVKWLNPSQMPNCPACPVTKVDLNGRKGCGKGSVKSKWMLAKNQPLATAKVQRSVTSYFS